MAGCKPFTLEQQKAIEADLLEHANGLRNAAWFNLGCNSGFRISELMAVKRGQLIAFNGEFNRWVTIQGKRRIKRRVMVNSGAEAMLNPWLDEMECKGMIEAERYVFATQTDKHLDPKYCLELLQASARRVGMYWEKYELGTHSMRKTFAQRFYDKAMELSANGEKVDPLRATSEALGHTNINNTLRYLQGIRSDIDAIIESIAS